MEPDAEIRFCKWCNGETGHDVIVRPIGPHYGEIVCQVCKNRWGFMGKPTNEGKRKKNKYTPQVLSINKCEMCQRRKDELINHETLEVHHVTQVVDGGPDTPENIWIVCTPCHKMIHHHRFYLRRASGDYS